MQVNVRVTEDPNPDGRSVESILNDLLAPGIGSAVARTTEGTLPTAVHGGTRGRDSNGRQACTFAFGVRSGATQGLLTAGHCNNMTDYIDPINGRTTAITLEQAYEGYYGDYGWYSIDDDVSSRFYVSRYSTRSARSVREWQDIAPGQYYCNFGRSSWVYR